MQEKRADYVITFSSTITVSGLEKYHYALVVTAGGCHLMHNTGINQTVLEWNYSDGYGMLNARRVWLDGNEIGSEDCYEIGIMNGMTTALNVKNGGCIPYYIYGVRGVYWEDV